jgi:hypothetical protein
MSMTNKTSAEMHTDHRRWKGDVDCWNDDITNWQSETETAISHLKQIIQKLQEHVHLINNHAELIGSIESGLEYHEKNLASALQSNSFTDLDNDLADRHVKEAELHRRQRFAHEAMKRKHHQAMAHVEMLKAMVDATLK